MAAEGRTTRRRNSVPIRGMLPAVLCSALLLGGAWTPVPRSAEVFLPERAHPVAEIYKFPLRATSLARGAVGAGQLRIAASPFGIAVTADGHVVYDLEVTVRGLRPSAALRRGSQYVVWITTRKLDRAEKLGVVEHEGTFQFRVSTMNKFILVVSLETSGDVAKRNGPVVLRGISPSGLMESFASHELFNEMPHDPE